MLGAVERGEDAWTRGNDQVRKGARMRIWRRVRVR